MKRSLWSLALICMFLLGVELAPKFAYAIRPRVAASSGSGSSGTVTSPATGAGVDTCTGAGCAIGAVGISTDGGFIASGIGADPAFLVKNSNSDVGLVQASNGNGIRSAGSGSTTRIVANGTNYDANASALNLPAGTSLNFAANPSMIVTKPSLTATGTGASVTGTGFSFVVDVGTGSPGSSLTLTFGVTASNGYNCACYDETASPLTTTKASSDTTTTCVITNYTVATGSAVSWAASDKVHCLAGGY